MSSTVLVWIPAKWGVAPYRFPWQYLLMHSGTGKNNKSYKLGVQYALEDLAAGRPRQFTYMEMWRARDAGQPYEYREWAQPRGYYASDMERGYQDTWRAAKPSPVIVD